MGWNGHFGEMKIAIKSMIKMIVVIDTGNFKKLSKCEKNKL